MTPGDNLLVCFQLVHISNIAMPDLGTDSVHHEMKFAEKSVPKEAGSPTETKQSVQPGFFSSLLDKKEEESDEVGLCFLSYKSCLLW